MQSFAIQKRFIQGPDFLELTPEHLEEQLVFARANSVTGFVIGHKWDNTPLADLHFLPGDSIRGLTISFEGVQDISAINSFHQLEVLHSGYMSHPQSEIHLENFPKLRVLNIYWNRKYKGLDRASSIISSRLWGYKPKSRDLRELQGWTNLASATLTQPGIDTLDGVENLERLRELELRNVRPLKHFFSDDREAKLPLEKLVFDLCKNFDIESIPPMASLKFLGFTQVGKQRTLRSVIAKFPNLETLVFTQSELEEGDLDYLLEHPTLKTVTIDHKKHYSLKEKEIQKRLEEKNKKSSV